MPEISECFMLGTVISHIYLMQEQKQRKGWASSPASITIWNGFELQTLYFSNKLQKSPPPQPSCCHVTLISVVCTKHNQNQPFSPDIDHFQFQFILSAVKLLVCPSKSTIWCLCICWIIRSPQKCQISSTWSYSWSTTTGLELTES